LRALPYVAFFLSGASSLIFQALWTRMLHHTFGATSVAMSSVLTAFMGGLGLGAHLFGKYVRRIRRPLLAYAACELGVALCAALLPPLVRSDGPMAAVNAGLRAALGESGPGFMLARFACVLPLLLVPTTLMGGTLPLLAQHFVAGTRSGQGAGAQVGALYALNTLGAVAGSLLGSFVLMPAIGVRATNWVAVAINAALGLFIVLLARREPAAASAERPAVEPVAATVPAAAWARSAVLVAFACSGACAMAYEVVWSRALSMAIGSSLQAFALILVTFLIGIAGGSALLSSLIGERRRARRHLLTLACAVPLLSLLALAPALVLSSAGLALGVWLLLCALIAVALRVSLGKLRQLAVFDPDLAGQAEDELAAKARRLLVFPAAIALFESVRFASHKSAFAGVSLHGYLPYITAAVVACLCVFLWLASALAERPWLQAAATQLFVAAATLVTCTFQDEIPYTFARLVSGVEDLPNQVGRVRFFMFFAASLCTLPATLGMGAMFPISLALYRSGARAVGEDVGRVYAANTLGSILGAWLPGFVLLPLFGMQRTLDAGIALNAATALLMLACARRLAGAGAQAQARASIDGSRALARASTAASTRTRSETALWLLSAGFSLFMLAVLCSESPPLRWNLGHMTLGAFRVSLAKSVLDVDSWGKADMIYYRDGVSTTVSVERWGRHLSLKNNGKVDASNGDDMPTQIMVAAYPLLLHTRGPRDLDVAIVGFGSGVTVGAALQFPVRHVEAMELERAVVEAAVDFFADVSHLPRRRDDFPYVDEPRLSLHNDDGRNFLASTPKRYDVIISEPSNPWITGVSDLFTVEHFRVTKRRLKPGGVYCQWVQLYEMSPENIKTIYRTFASQFRYVLAFAAEELSSDTILVGSDTPLPLDLRHVERALADTRVSAELERAYVHSAHDVWSRILFASREQVLQFAQLERRREGGRFVDELRATGAAACPPAECQRSAAPLNTDDNMLIELRAPADLIGFARYEGYLTLFYGLDWPYGGLAGRLAGVDTQADRARLALSLLAHGRKRQAQPFVAALDAGAGPEVELARETARLLLDQLPAPEPALQPPSPSLFLEPWVREAFDQAAQRAAEQYARAEYKAGLATMNGIPELLRRLSGPDFRFLYGLLLYRGADGDRDTLKRAVLELEDLIRKDELYARAHPELYYFLAKALDGAASFDKAARNMRVYVQRRLLPN
jgi:spermidine synthase